MYINRANILNNYAKQTLNKGKMYYIYDKNSKMAECYNLCICEEGNSHTIIEKSKDELPRGAKIGSVLRMAENKFVLDEEATMEISQEINKMKDEILNKQTNFLESKRIEGHIYEMSEKSDDRAWLYDITNGNNNVQEEVEEIDFPNELLKDDKISLEEIKYIKETPNFGFKTIDKEKDLFDLLESLLSNELNYFSAMLSKQELGNIIKIASKEKSNEDIASKFLELIKE